MYEISLQGLTLEEIPQILKGKISLSGACRAKVRRCREYLDDKMRDESQLIYGINTGFGALHNKRISPGQLEQLQENLVMSHACGMGEVLPEEIVRLMLLLKVQGLAFGHSGVQESTIDGLINFYNHGIYPVVYQQGSLGASGDLAPLAHLTLPLTGRGEVHYRGLKMQAAEALHACNLEPLQLKSKEGLALLNGTQFMSAYGVWILLKTRHLFSWANTIAALSLDAYDGRTEPFFAGLHTIRKQKGQETVAARMRSLLEGSGIASGQKEHVQDPYSFRCIPQVHGATLDALRHIKGVFQAEINSVTDNPTIFPEDDLIISGGNFHGQPLALAFDYLSVALAELGSISERRTYKLISGGRGLPPFLVSDPGLNSGMMIPQYTAASIVSQNKQLCTPSSVDTIDSSNGQEDHVSMGANGATRCYRVVENLERILAIELMNAAQALEFRRPLKSSLFLERLVTAYRREVPELLVDRYLHDDMIKTVKFLENYQEELPAEEFH